MNKVRATRRRVARAIAVAWLSGEWHPVPMMARADAALDAGGPWLRNLAYEAVTWWRTPPRHAINRLTGFVEHHPAFRLAWSDGEVPHQVAHWWPVTPEMAPPAFPVRRLDTLGDVAAWLGVDAGTLEWFADRRGLLRHATSLKLMHYRRRWLERPGALPRLLESPLDRLKAIQRRVLADVLAHVPAHDAAHGFVPGRSVLTHAALHVGRAAVIRFDLQSFFTHVHTARVEHIFRACGYPDEVALTLTGLCTTRAPERVLSAAPLPPGISGEAIARLFLLKRTLAGRHLPQGAPTSPALANLCSYALDVRLTALAERFAATYSRYADDLVFSGDATLGGATRRLTVQVDAIVREEGHHLNPAKTRCMRASQRQEVTGVVVNARPSVRRADVDRLRATLHRLWRTPPTGLNAEQRDAARAQLQGRVAWIEQVSAVKGRRLRALFQQIDWNA